jgi:transcriptional regulator with XRE-family HTH domain
MYDFSVLRELRKRDGLTIQGVSERAGVSAAVISKLERNQSQAELGTLFKLSRVFGLNATDLISLAESRTAQRSTAQEYVSGDFRFQRVNYANVKAYHGFGDKGAKVSRPEVHQDDYEVCWVTTGLIRITLPHETHELGAGEALQFDAVQAHSYEALADCEFIILHLDKGKRF